jgi:alkanesulfonate monooxygenase SsuD/methylene tetrahydromethanopterin reductase-like flavin-dependent oxidoreductase (luciferase family)
MHRAVGVPTLADYADPHVLVELALGAERAGWDGFFIWDHLVPDDPETPAADTQVALTAIVAATNRITAGALVTPLPRRRPHKVAKEIATLQQLARGRLIFGAAIGWSAELEYEAFGEDGSARGDRLDEALQVVSRLWTGEPVDFAGEHYTVRGIRFEPSAAIPIWIGGGWPAKRPFRRAARWDGVMPIVRGAAHEDTMAPELLREIVAYTLSHRPSHLGPLDVVMEGNTEGDRAALREYKSAGLSWYVEKLGWWRGSLDHVREQIHRGPPET